MTTMNNGGGGYCNNINNNNNNININKLDRINVAEAVGNNLVVYGVLQIRCIREIYIEINHFLKRCTTRTIINGG